MLAVNLCDIVEVYDFLICDLAVYPVKFNGNPLLAVNDIILLKAEPASMNKLLIVANVISYLHLIYNNKKLIREF